MQKRFGKCRAGWLGGLVISWMMATGVLAQPSVDKPSKPEASPSPATASDAASDSSDWWLGVQCRPVDAALRAHLGLAEAEGLVVEKVVPQSPAEKTELQRHDVLVKADGKPLRSPLDLIGAVNGKEGKAFSLEYLRGGQKHEVTMKPEHRPDWARVVSLNAKADQESQLFRNWLQQLQLGEPGSPLRFRVIRPGMILPPGAPAYPALPSNVSITIAKRGGELAKVTVTRDDKKWEVAENELDKLPKDLAPYAKCMLGRPLPDQSGAVQLYEFVPGRVGHPQAEHEESAQSAPDATEAGKGDPVQQRLEMMTRQLEQLRRSMDELRKSQPE